MGIISYGTYVPRYRLQRRAIGTVLGTGGGSGTRSVAGYDEDTTTMAVAAARGALRAAGDAPVARVVALATTRPAYLDKTNATAIHAALGLPQHADAVDCAGSTRSGHAAFDLAAAGSGIAVMSDIRWGRPTSAEELDGGDGAAAFVMGPDADSVAVEFARGVATAEFMDRWRVPSEPAVSAWEDRFGEHAYRPLVAAAATQMAGQAGATIDTFDHVIVTGLHARAARSAIRDLGVRSERLVADLAGEIGNTGAAHPWLLLARTLDVAGPDESIALVHLADGCVVRAFHTTHRLAAAPRPPAAGTTLDAAYADVLTWRGVLDREPPRRPQPDVPAAPPSLRASKWKFGFYGSLDAAGNVHVPPARVSLQMRAAGAMEPVRLADTLGTIANVTVDRLAYSLSPPVIVAIVDFDGGGRYQCTLTDTTPDTVHVGQRVEMTFRNLYTQDGVHNYFWKARPVDAQHAPPQGRYV